jgi:hypothetical protein
MRESNLATRPTTDRSHEQGGPSASGPAGSGKSIADGIEVLPWARDTTYLPNTGEAIADLEGGIPGILVVNSWLSGDGTLLRPWVDIAYGCRHNADTK